MPSSMEDDWTACDARGAVHVLAERLGFDLALATQILRDEGMLRAAGPTLESPMERRSGDTMASSALRSATKSSAERRAVSKGAKTKDRAKQPSKPNQGSARTVPFMQAGQSPARRTGVEGLASLPHALLVRCFAAASDRNLRRSLVLSMVSKAWHTAATAMLVERLALYRTTLCSAQAHTVVALRTQLRAAFADWSRPLGNFLQVYVSDHATTRLSLIELRGMVRPPRGVPQLFMAIVCLSQRVHPPVHFDDSGDRLWEQQVLPHLADGAPYSNYKMGRFLSMLKNVLKPAAAEVWDYVAHVLDLLDLLGSEDSLSGWWVCVIREAGGRAGGGG